MTHTKGMFFALAAFFLWVVMDAGIKWGSQSALSPFAIMAIMGTVGALGVLGMGLVRRDIGLLYPRHPRQQIILCLCSLIINYSMIVALKHLPLTIYYIVVFSSPLVVALLSSLFKHEVLTPVKIACLVAGFIGVVVAVATRGAGNGEWIGYAAGFTNVAFFSLYTVTMRGISATAATESVLLPSFVIIGIAGMAGVWQEGGFPVGNALWIVLFAAVINFLGNLFYNTALKHTLATNVMQLHYTQIIWGAILGYLLWHEMPTWNLLAGSALIIGSGIIVASQANKLKTR